MPDRMTHPAWKLDCLSDWSQVWDPGFLDLWQGLSEQSAQANVFYSIPLVRAWTDTYRQLAAIEPRFLTGRDETGAEAVLPMVLFRRGWKGGWLRSLEPVGANEFDYHDALIAGDDSSAPLPHGFWSAAAALLHPSRPEWDVMHIPRLRTPPPVDTFPVASSDAAPFVDLSMFGSFDSYLASRPSRHRQDLRRQQRRLLERGPVKVRWHNATDPLPLQQAMEALALHRRSRWPNAYEAPGLLHNIVKEGMPSGTVQFAELRVGDRPVAWHLGFAHRRSFHYYLPAFEPEMAAYSPGKVLLAGLIEEAIRQRFSRFDLLSGREPYKTVWQTGETPLASVEERHTSAGARIRMSAGRTARRLATLRRRCLSGVPL